MKFGHMSLKTVFSRKDSWTKTALKFFFAGMYDHVPFQLRRILKLFETKMTNISLKQKEIKIISYESYSQNQINIDSLIFLSLRKIELI